jgi:DNA repair protein RadC
MSTTRDNGRTARRGPSEGARADDAVIAAALGILERRIRAAECLSSPQAVRDYLRLRLGTREHEVFMAVWLDAQHRVIATDELLPAPHADERLSARGR